MCELCKESGGGVVYCQDCGAIICFDIKHGDDLLAPAYVTNSGNVFFCARCGMIRPYRREGLRLYERSEE